MLFRWIWKCFYVLDDLFFLPFFLFSFFFFFFFAIIKDIVLFKIYFKSSIFSKQHSSSEIWDCQWHKPFSVTLDFTALILLFLFQIIKKYQCRGFTFTNFFFLLTTTNALAISWVTFWQTRMLAFFQFLDLTFPPKVAWWK